jgi:[ribulose-bisphosphate carboxylase]/[fructose-bisphosphate aldolase]-lysine N-methyltransferase
MTAAFACYSWSLSGFHTRSSVLHCGVKRASHVQSRMSAQSSTRAELCKLVENTGGTLNPALNISEERPELIAESSISKDAEIISIPGSVVLSTTSGSKTFGPEFSKLSLQGQLAVLFLAERVKGEDSSFRFLIEELTQREDLDHPYRWTPEQLEWLQGSSLGKKAVLMRSGLEKEWNEVEKLIGSFSSCEDYLWAHGIIDGCAFELGSSFPLALIPLVHRVERVTQGKEHNVRVVATAPSFFSKPRIALVATQDINPGAPLLAGCAGTGLSASEFLLSYGAIPMTSSVVSVPSSVELAFAVSSLDQFYDDKADVLEINDQVESPSFLLTDSLERGAWVPPDGMEQFVRLLCLGGQDAFLLEGVFRRDVWEFMDRPVSLRNEQAMCEAMIGACEDAIENYSEIDVQSESTLQKSRARTARVIVEGEKRVLMACLEHYKREIQSLDAKEYYQERRLNELDLLRPLDESEIVDSEGGRRMGRSFDENY